MLTVTHKVLDKGVLDAWVKTAKPGEACLYHDGVLASDRVEGGLREKLRINTLANTALDMAQSGYLHLIQRRIRADRYEYIALRTSKPFETSALIPRTAIAA